MSKRTKENPKENPKVRTKVPKAYIKVKHRKLVSQVMKTRNRRQAQKLRNWDMPAPLTLPATMNGMMTNGRMAGVLMNGMMTGVLLDGTKVGNKRMTFPQAHFHLEVWMTVPPVKMNLDTGSAVNTFSLNFGSRRSRRYGRFCRTASGEWMDCAQCVVQCCRKHEQRTTRFLPRT